MTGTPLYLTFVLRMICLAILLPPPSKKLNLFTSAAVALSIYCSCHQSLSSVPTVIIFLVSENWLCRWKAVFYFCLHLNFSDSSEAKHFYTFINYWSSGVLFLYPFFLLYTPVFLLTRISLSNEIINSLCYTFAFICNLVFI